MELCIRALYCLFYQCKESNYYGKKYDCKDTCKTDDQE
jgi:hypothetical protein